MGFEIIARRVQKDRKNPVVQQFKSLDPAGFSFSESQNTHPPFLVPVCYSTVPNILVDAEFLAVEGGKE